MTATNHVLTGVVLLSIIHNPAIGLPVALVSHVLLDMFPHFGNELKQAKSFTLILFSDMTLAALVLLTLFLARPVHYWLLIAGGVTCASPDLLSIPIYIRMLRHQAPKKLSGLQGFLSRIQWSESVPGLAVEVVWAMVMSSIVYIRVFLPGAA